MVVGSAVGVDAAGSGAGVGAAQVDARLVVGALALLGALRVAARPGVAQVVLGTLADGAVAARLADGSVAARAWCACALAAEVLAGLGVCALVIGLALVAAAGQRVALVAGLAGAHGTLVLHAAVGVVAARGGLTQFV